VNQDRESAAVLRSNSRYLGNSAAIASGLAPRAWLNANGLASTPTFDIFAPVFGGSDPFGSAVTMGKETYSFFQSYTADLEYTQKIGDNLVYQLQGNFAIDDFEILRSIGGDQEPFANGTVRFRFGNFANYRDSYNFDNKFTYRFRLGETSHTLALGQESQRVYQDTPGWFDTLGRFQDGRYGAFAVWNPQTQALRNAAQLETRSRPLLRSFTACPRLQDDPHRTAHRAPRAHAPPQSHSRMAGAVVRTNHRQSLGFIGG